MPPCCPCSLPSWEGIRLLRTAFERIRQRPDINISQQTCGNLNSDIAQEWLLRNARAWQEQLLCWYICWWGRCRLSPRSHSRLNHYKFRDKPLAWESIATRRLAIRQLRSCWELSQEPVLVRDRPQGILLWRTILPVRKTSVLLQYTIASPEQELAST